jgi:hypothetical protein
MIIELGMVVVGAVMVGALVVADRMTKRVLLQDQRVYWAKRSNNLTLSTPEREAAAGQVAKLDEQSRKA